jgi:ABC-type phosphate transport system substrate-binding protein
MRRITKCGLAGAATFALAIGLVSPAFADYAPGATDVVGVGSDTVQNIMDFVADGDQLSDGGYNTTGNINKLVSFDATPDSNDRAGYLNGSTNASLKPLTPTIVLRGGLTPVARPNGSGAGIAALEADTAGNISFVRSSRPPTQAEVNVFVAQHNNLDTVQIAKDPLEIAYATANSTGAAVVSNMPTAGLSAQQLVAIYSGTKTTWNQVGGSATSTIIPLIPQTGSGTRSTFLADLQAANGGTAITLGSNVVTVEENDPTSLTGAASPADAIAPFSEGRFNLYSSTTPYFHNPSTGVALAPGIALQHGFQSDGTTARVSTDGANPVYDDVRGLFILFRDSDLADAPWQPGGTKNWANVLFVGTNPYVKSAAAASLIQAAGVSPAYVNEGAGYHVG